MLDGKAIKSTETISTIETMMNIVTTYTDTEISLGQKTAEIIVKNKGDYVLQLKENQKNLYEDVYAMFDDYHIQENTGK